MVDPATQTMTDLLETFKHEIQNEKKKIALYSKVAKTSLEDIYTLYDTLIALFPIFTYCKDTGEIAINGIELLGSNLFEILPFLTKTQEPKQYPPKGTAPILELLSQTSCPSMMFPNSVIRKLFMKYRYRHFHK